ncbi:MAG: penicillin-binding protein 1A [Desulfobacteraceae bacterium]|nr:penicillin-binding protein 1A [Desulfobacteraceae bacterium]
MKRRTKFGIYFFTILAGVLSGITAGAFTLLTKDLPQIQELENYKPSAATRVYSVEQELIGEFYLERRTPITLDQIPKDLITAFLATEDRKFYRHSGIVIQSIVRAMVKNISSGRYVEGASTLTQQLAKTLFLTPRKTLLRKLREAVLAIQLERRYTKNEILELYLNQIYLGSGAYGVNSAARLFFRKPVQELTLAECALVAGLAQSPSRYSPFINHDLARKRRNNVLKKMLNTGAITKKVYKQALEQPVPTQASHEQGKGEIAPYFVQFIKKRLEAAVGDLLMYKGGLTVYTTVDYDLQQTAERAVTDGLNELEKRMVANSISNPDPQAGLVALRVQTGEILCLVGGRNFSKSQFDRAVLARRQPGSAFKPVIFALAIEKGFEQTQLLLDAPVVFQNPLTGRDWQPKNFSGAYEGEISLRRALAKSKNVPAVRLMEMLSPSSAVEFAKNMGISAPLLPNLSLALGVSEISLLELTSAYTVFANHGKYIQPYGITEIRNDQGKVIWRSKPHQRIAMSRTGAAIVTDMLNGVINEGTGQKTRAILSGPLAGKTGTTNEFRDALFIGYSPAIAVGVWVGNDNASSLGPGESGARAAMPIWIKFMQSSPRQNSQLYFDIPDDVRAVHIHSRTGKLTSEYDPNAVKALVRRQ